MSKIKDRLLADLDIMVERLRALPPDEAFVLGEEIHRVLLDYSKEVGKARRTAVRELRARGLTLREIGEMTGVSPNRVYQIERGMTRGEKGR